MRKQLLKQAFLLGIVCLIVLSSLLIPKIDIKSMNYGLSNQAFQVTIDGVPVKFDDVMGYPLITKTQRTLVPIRIIAENMGYKVDWNQNKQQALVKGGGVDVTITIGENTAVINGKTVPIDIQDGIVVDTKAELIAVKGSKRTYVPLRFISEATGAKVDYQQRNGVHYITITTKKNTTPGKIAFNPATDTLEDGRMTEEKTKEYLDEMVKNVKVYKENGKMYLKYNLIDLPQGYLNGFNFSSNMKGGTGEVGYALTTGNAYIPENQLPRNQSFVIELKPEKMKNIEFYSINLSVAKTNYQGRVSSSSMYYISYNPNTEFSDVLIYDKWGSIIEKVDFDKTLIFGKDF